MDYELITNDHHNNNCALFKCWGDEKNHYKKVSFSEIGNSIIKNEKLGYSWFYSRIGREDETELVKAPFYEINIPEFIGKSFPTDAIITGNEREIDRLIEFYRAIWLTKERYVIHGDLALCNVVINGLDDLMIIDWEHFHVADKAFFGFDIINMLFISVIHQFKSIERINSSVQGFLKRCICKLFIDVPSDNKIMPSPFAISSNYLKDYRSRFNLHTPIERKFVISRFDSEDLKKLDSIVC